mgnify:FL=1
MTTPSTPVFRDYDRERAEGVSGVRGILVGLLFALPFWAAVAGVIALSTSSQ